MRTLAAAKKTGELEIGDASPIVRPVADPVRSIYDFHGVGNVSAGGMAQRAATGAGPLGAAEVVPLQRLVGNQSVMRMLDLGRRGEQAKAAGPSVVQAMPLEQLAEDAEIQRAPATLLEPSDQAIHSAAAEGVRTPSVPLPHRDRIQASFGNHPVGHIQAHLGEGASRASRAMNALAYASGDHVVFGAPPDLRTAAHEAAHVVQQRAGVQLTGGIGRRGDAYERHADAVASAVVAGRSAEDVLEASGSSANGFQSGGSLARETGVQRYDGKDNLPELEDAPAVEDASMERVNVELPPAVPIGGGHHVTIREVDGELRLGVASEFKTAEKLIQVLLRRKNQLEADDVLRVEEIRAEIRGIEKSIAEHRKEADATRIKRVTKKIKHSSPPRAVKPSADNPAKSSKYWDVPLAVGNFKQYSAKGVKIFAARIRELWGIGDEILPMTLMPSSEVFKNKKFSGNKKAYHYHTGSITDPIPITWYKAKQDYPELKEPLMSGEETFAFGTSIWVNNLKIGVVEKNRPKIGWMIRKVAHQGVRTKQLEINVALRSAGFRVKKNGKFVDLKLGDGDGFDGDHVKDLGFGGTDSADNYWPLSSRINRRAYEGYNAHYIVNYRERNAFKARAIGGLIGKWFRVKAFLKAEDGPVPKESNTAPAGGTPK
jgi:hypothetical protein